MVGGYFSNGISGGLAEYQSQTWGKGVPGEGISSAKDLWSEKESVI